MNMFHSTSDTKRTIGNAILRANRIIYTRNNNLLFNLHNLHIHTSSNPHEQLYKNRKHELRKLRGFFQT